ncbi:MAG: protein kinase [Rhodothermales bacterium]|nr:protein kinase [Rhodothermales bacterium]
MVGSTIAQYEILEQLGSGGMGVVYKARDTRLDRVVALKFLPPQLSQDQTTKERFTQEARAASSLDDPHICTIHDIAETDDGQLFIVMAYYDGNTLKYLVDERQIDTEEACSIARQMAKGLAAAHEAGIVHRDVKPANIMVTSRGLVKILDFGVAKLGESSDLTREGSTLGTAAYMSPEQAQGEPVDHRSDVWSVGVVLYELLAGSRPFGGGYDAAVAYSIVNEDPPDLETQRPGLPDGLADIVKKCLQKSSGDRMASASALADALAAFTDASAVNTVEQSVYVASQSAPTAQRTLILFGLVAAVFLAILYGAMLALGLPDWVFPAGVLLMLIGVPIVIYSLSLDRKRAKLDSGERAKLKGLKAWLTTRKAFAGGVLAVSGLLVLVLSFVGLKAAGVGPFATLISGGTLSAQDLLIVADFDNRTNDAALGKTVTEAFKIDLSQSTAVRLMDRSAIQSALQRMQVNADTVLDASLAMAIAEREGVKAIVEGDVNSAGASFILNARVLSALDGSRLAAFRKTAKDDTDIVDAIDRLSAELREEIGESLVDIRGNDPLEQVTTTSVKALRLHTEAENISGLGQETEAIELLKEAIKEDSLFAMAYRKLAVLYGNTNAPNQLRDEAATKAYELRERMPWRERMLAEANYLNSVEDDDEAVIRTYEEILRRYPYDVAALNNLALEYNISGRYVEAEPLLRKALEVSEGTVFHANLFRSVASQGRLDEALVELDDFEVSTPGYYQIPSMRATVFYAKRDFESAHSWVDSIETRAKQPFQLANFLDQKDNLLFALGRLNEADIYRQQYDTYRLDRQIRDDDDLPREVDSLFRQIDREHEKALITGDTREFEKRLQELMNLAERFGGIPDDRDPYGGIARRLTSLGLIEEATEWVGLMKGHHERTGEELPTFDTLVAAYHDALSGGDINDAVEVINKGVAEWGCDRCWRWELGQLHERANDADAAIDAYQVFVDTPSPSAIWADEGLFALTEFRLGALFEEKGELDLAITYYTRMTERWKDADAVLQPQVSEAKRRIEALLDRKAREQS